ncbi:MAG TPA: transglycosylase SLT domain-containing protein, partial [Gemmatimonadales bacterium]|nr:transglycosylase SLT domain-containing protein [Gemmatimonadales bacterium]
MTRAFPLIPLVLLAACGGHRPAPSSEPAPESAAQATPRAAPGRSDAGVAAVTAGPATHLLPPAPELDSIIPAEELAAELRLASDSAADEAVLEALAEATPGEGDPGVEAEDPKALAPVTWDIDVATYNSHDRVRWYLDFFQGKGRERMGIWLNRMPRYEPMIRERLQREGLPGDLVYLALIESGFSNTATSRARAVGMWQF